MSQLNPSLVQTSRGKYQQHPFHVLYLSRLPMVMGALAGNLALAIIVKLHPEILDTCSKFFGLGNFLPLFNLGNPSETADFIIIQILVLILITMWAWGRELVNESTHAGFHTTNVVTGLKYGMLLFLASEMMLFFPFFWAFFHATLSPAVTLGSVWPPEGIAGEETLDAFMLPLVNTLVLLSSGVALVAAHRAIIAGCNTLVLNGLFIAVCLGILFSWLQYLEYGLTKYTIADGLYGSTFFMLTGLHGFHVLVGTCLLLITYWRAVQKQFSRERHMFFEAAAWYWHFVDVIWLFVFALVYLWGVDLATF